MEEAGVYAFDVAFQGVAVDEGGDDPLPGYAERGSVGGDFCGLFHGIAVGEVDCERGDEGIGGAGGVYRGEAYGGQIAGKCGGVDIAAGVPKGDDD